MKLLSRLSIILIISLATWYAVLYATLYKFCTVRAFPHSYITWDLHEYCGGVIEGTDYIFPINLIKDFRTIDEPLSPPVQGQGL